MKRMILLNALLLLIFYSVNAQQPQPSDNGNNRVSFAGYLIKIIPLNGNGFGYDIFFKNRLVVHQWVNPFTLAPTGLKEKEDVLKIARWQIMQMHRSPANRTTKNQLIAKDVAKRLDISIKSYNN